MSLTTNITNEYQTTKGQAWTSLLTKCEYNTIVIFFSATGIFVSVTAFIALVQFISHRLKQVEPDGEDSLHELIRVRQTRWLPEHVQLLLLGKTVAGKTMILVRTLLYAVAAITYVWNTYQQQGKLCVPLNGQVQYAIELACTVIFSCILVLKLIASQNLLFTWMSFDTVLGLYTGLPQLLAPVYGYYQYNFGFIYFTRVSSIAEVLVLLRLVQNERTICRLKLVSKLIAAWFAMAGLVFLLERLGNFWEDSRVPNKLDYFDTVYFLLVTVSTVGYGDIVCTSFFGRLSVIIVIVSTLASITTHMSELYELFPSRQQYTGSFSIEYHPRHVVVCGNLNYETVSTFLHEFLHADNARYDRHITLLLMSEQPIGLGLKLLLQGESVRTVFLQGSMTSLKDLRRAKIWSAQAVIILSDWRRQTWVHDDWENILRVVAVKKVDPQCRVVCMLNSSKSEMLLSNIPGWQEGCTGQLDQAISMNYLKLGLMSVNCISSGASTLLSNLLVRVPVPSALNKNRCGSFRWISNYYDGSQFNLYTVKFSQTFDGMLFQQVVSIAMKALNTIVLAVQFLANSEESTHVIINPGKCLRINSQQMHAVVMADSYLSAQALRAYCLNCHGNHVTTDSKQTRRLSYCRHRAPSCAPISTVDNSCQPSSECKESLSFGMSKICRGLLYNERPVRRRSSQVLGVSRGKQGELGHLDTSHTVEMTRDSTGLFYWTAARDFDNACIPLSRSPEPAFSNHVLVCLSWETNSAHLGLASFVMPLRSTRIPTWELKPILFLCNSGEVVRNEWQSLQNFPQVYFIVGSPLSRVCLLAAGVSTCSTCVVLSSSEEAIGENALMADKETIMCTLTIQRLLVEIANNEGTTTTGRKPLVITELSQSNSSALLSGMELFDVQNGLNDFNPQFAAGTMFSSPILNNLPSTVFFDPIVAVFLETVLLGCQRREVKRVYAEDRGFCPGPLGESTTLISIPGFHSNLHSPNELEAPESLSTNRINPTHLFFRKMDKKLLLDDVQQRRWSWDDQFVVPTSSSSEKSFSTGVSTVFDEKYTCGSLKTSSLGGSDVALDGYPSRKTRRHCRRKQPGAVPKLSRQKHDRERSETQKSKCFLSYPNLKGDCVKVRQSRLQLSPISELAPRLADRLKETDNDDESANFGELFRETLQLSSTICIGLYRRLSNEEMHENGTSSMPSQKQDSIGVKSHIDRYVYTFPRPGTRLFPDDLVYNFTSMIEERGNETSV